MPKRKGITITKHTFDEDLTDERIEYWQSLGQTAIWKACRELSLLGFLFQGIDARGKPLDKEIIERRPVPWTPASGQPENTEDQDA